MANFNKKETAEEEYENIEECIHQAMKEALKYKFEDKTKNPEWGF